MVHLGCRMVHFRNHLNRKRPLCCPPVSYALMRELCAHSFVFIRPSRLHPNPNPNLDLAGRHDVHRTIGWQRTWTCRHWRRRPAGSAALTSSSCAPVPRCERCESCCRRLLTPNPQPPPQPQRQPPRISTRAAVSARAAQTTTTSTTSTSLRASLRPRGTWSGAASPTRRRRRRCGR